MSIIETLASKLGCEIEYDYDCIRATAPHGKCFEQGLHELVSVFGGSNMTETEALSDMAERLAFYQLEDCKQVDCDWCKV